MYSFPSTVILAGGLATRLGDLTRTCPKAMIEVADEPFIAHLLRLLSRQKVSRVVLCVSHLADQIQQYVGDGSKFNMEVAYSSDGPTLLGTGGAVKKAFPLLDEEFGILYGDSYLDIDFEPVYRAFQLSRKLGLMTVLLNNDRWDKSNVIFRQGAIEAYDKDIQSPDFHYIDYGLSIMSKSVFHDYQSDVPFDLSQVVKDLVAKKQLAGLEVHQRFYEIGTRQGLDDTDVYLRRNSFAS